MYPLVFLFVTQRLRTKRASREAAGRACNCHRQPPYRAKCHMAAQCLSVGTGTIVTDVCQRQGRPELTLIWVVAMAMTCLLDV